LLFVFVLNTPTSWRWEDEGVGAEREGIKKRAGREEGRRKCGEERTGERGRERGRERDRGMKRGRGWKDLCVWGGGGGGGGGFCCCMVDEEDPWVLKLHVN